MAVLFLDTSALVKRYVAEIGSTWVRSISDPTAGNRCWVVSVTRVEVLAALYRRVRTGSLSLPQLGKTEATFRSEIATIFRSIPVSAGVLTEAMRLVAIHPLRAYDAIQLAAAVSLHAQRLAAGFSAPVFLCADTNLTRAAIAEGLTTDDPNLHP